jgi:transcription elongation factor GreA
MTDTLHLSASALDRLKAELEERTTTRRKEITLRIEEARAHGDLSENAEYDAAKNDQGHNEARIRQLEDMIKRAVVVESTGNATDVQPGCLVELRYEGDDDTTTYLYGSIEERHDTYEVLSTSSPLGVALAGKKPGERVTYQGPKRELAAEVVAVRAP